MEIYHLNANLPGEYSWFQISLLSALMSLIIIPVLIFVIIYKFFKRFLIRRQTLRHAKINDTKTFIARESQEFEYKQVATIHRVERLLFQSVPLSLVAGIIIPILTIMLPFMELSLFLSIMLFTYAAVALIGATVIHFIYRKK